MDFDSQSRYCRPDGVWYTETEASNPIHGKLKTIRPFAPGQRWERARGGAAPARQPLRFTLKQPQGALWAATDDVGGTVFVDMAVEAFDLSRNVIRPYVFVGWSDQAAAAKPAKYPGTCPRCKSPAYVGAVPTALDCSNDKCPSKTKGGGIRK